MSDERLKRIEDKVDKLLTEQVAIRLDLNYHIKRTDILESELRPVREHVTSLRVIGRWIAIAALIAGILRLVL